MYPFAKWTHIVGTLGSLLLVIMSYRWPKISKIFLCYNMVLVLVHQCLLNDVSRGAENFIMLLMYIIFYFTTHFDIWVSLVATVLSQAANIVIQIMLYEAMIEEAMLGFFLNIVFMIFGLLVAHVVITLCGLYYSNAEVQREENIQFLNDLEEGLIIIDNDTNQILF